MKQFYNNSYLDLSDQSTQQPINDKNSIAETVVHILFSLDINCNDKKKLLSTLWNSTTNKTIYIFSKYQGYSIFYYLLLTNNDELIKFLIDHAEYSKQFKFSNNYAVTDNISIHDIQSDRSFELLLLLSSSSNMKEKLFYNHILDYLKTKIINSAPCKKVIQSEIPTNNITLFNYLTSYIPIPGIININKQTSDPVIKESYDYSYEDIFRKLFPLTVTNENEEIPTKDYACLAELIFSINISYVPINKVFLKATDISSPTSDYSNENSEPTLCNIILSLDQQSNEITKILQLLDENSIMINHPEYNIAKIITNAPKLAQTSYAMQVSNPEIGDQQIFK